jgi:8-oxo-dGTP pyrophosphatase MutT (NUDIX family)
MDYSRRFKYRPKLICHNCEKIGHTSKMCKLPITSWGIILVKVDGLKDTDIKHEKNTKIDSISKIVLSDDNDIMKASILTEQIKFLMVSRKHSLGYTEFMMGRYSLSNIDHITFLIQQMLPEEIEKIKQNINDFDTLWKDLWNETTIKQTNIYNNSRTLFNRLNSCEVEIELDFLLEKTKTLSLYETPEYGFPKGRKNLGENPRDCAVREFCEETGFDKEDIKIIDEIEPIVENLIGTNGIKYIHIYYVAELLIDKDISTIQGDGEIGDMNFYSYNDTKYHIRPYHIEKINIVTNLLFYYLNKFLIHNKSKIQE